MDSSSVPAQPTLDTTVHPATTTGSSENPEAVPAAGSASAATPVKQQNAASASPPPTGRGGHVQLSKLPSSQGGGGPSRQRQEPLPNNCIVLKNLAYGITTLELENVVREITGDRKAFVNVALVEDKNTKSFRGMAFINFHTVDDAQKWLPPLQQLRFNNRKVYAEFRRMRPGEKERREAREQRAKGNFGNNPYKRSTFEDDVVTSTTDENGNEMDLRASFFAARDSVKKADTTQRPFVEKQSHREKELEDDFRSKLVEYRDAPVADGESIQDVVFDQDLSSFERRIVHVLCDELGLGHVSRSVDGARLLFVTKDPGRIALWELETADARKAAAEKAAEKAALAEQKTIAHAEKRKAREAQGKVRGEGAASARSASPETKALRGKGSLVDDAASHGVLLAGPATEEELKGINWSKFRPKSAMGEKDGDGGEGSVGMLKKPTYKVLVPPRQPTGPDGTIGFKRRNPNADADEPSVTEKGEASSSSKPGNGATSGAGKARTSSGEDVSDDASGATSTSGVTGGVRTIKLNPNVPAFEFPSAL